MAGRWADGSPSETQCLRQKVKDLERRLAKTKQQVKEVRTQCSTAIREAEDRCSTTIREAEAQIPSKPPKRTRPWRRKYSLPQHWYLDTLAKQGGVCDICKQPPKGTLCVDHDHRTGDIRGLLCSTCNSGIGFLRENPDILREAIAYLAKHKPSDEMYDPEVRWLMVANL